ncbi:hypothetical protein [Herbihabitans rhizosphaerae]|nr:hypothetical protein [Herbihabitans rhizosphaerae]
MGAPQHGGPPPAPPVSSRDIARVASLLALVVGLIAIGYFGYLAVDDLAGKNYGDGAAAAVTVFGGLLSVSGALLLFRRSRAGRVLIILGSAFELAVLELGDIEAFGLAAAAVVAAVLAFLSRAWCHPKRVAQPYGYPPAQGHGPPPQQRW